MSEDNTQKPNPLTTALASINELKNSNPRAFYIGIGAIVLILFWMVAVRPGGEDRAQSALVVGQSYTINNPNGGKVVLVSAAMMSSSEYTGEDSGNVCVLDSGASAKLKQSRIVNYIPFAQLEITSGECAGKSGWTSAVNIKK